MVLPLIAPGCAGKATTDTTSACAVLVPHILPAVTETVPPAGPTVAVMVVPVELPDQPDGKDQVYEVAPFTGDMLYACVVPWQGAASPVIEPGWDGIAITVTASVCAVLLPHELFAVTEIVPPVEPIVAVMVVPVELPDQPEGNTQV